MGVMSVGTRGSHTGGKEVWNGVWRGDMQKEDMIVDELGQVIEWSGPVTTEVRFSPMMLRWLLQGKEVVIEGHGGRSSFSFKVEMELPEMMVLMAERMDEYLNNKT